MTHLEGSSGIYICIKAIYLHTATGMVQGRYYGDMP